MADLEATAREEAQHAGDAAGMSDLESGSEDWEADDSESEDEADDSGSEDESDDVGSEDESDDVGPDAKKRRSSPPGPPPPGASGIGEKRSAAMKGSPALDPTPDDMPTKKMKGGNANNPLKKAFDLMTNFNKLLFKTNENGTQEIDHEKIKLLANLQYITLNNKHYYNSAEGDPTKTAAVVKGVEEKQSSGADEEIKPSGNIAKGTLAKGSQIMRKMFGRAYAKLFESGSRTAGTIHKAASQLSPRLPAFPKPPVSGGKSTSSKKTRKKREKNKRRRFTYKKYNL